VRQRTAKLKIATDLASSSAVASAATQVRAQREREDAAVTQLAQLDERGRTALAAAAVEACRYPHFALQIRDAVVRGDLPERPLAKMAVFKALRTLSSKGILP
jgi:Trm5-related predicted tRNA methylase